MHQLARNAAQQPGLHRIQSPRPGDEQIDLLIGYILYDLGGSIPLQQGAFCLDSLRQQDLVGFIQDRLARCRVLSTSASISRVVNRVGSTASSERVQMRDSNSGVSTGEGGSTCSR